MGGSGSSEAPNEDEASREVLLLTPQQARRLETELVRMSAKKTLEIGNVIEDPDGADLPARGGWESYHDTAELALTRRFWWLREHGGLWHLRAPSHELPAESLEKEGPFQDFTSVAKILEVLGLSQLKELFAQGISTNVQQLFAQAGVLPFARFNTERTVYTLHLDAVVRPAAGTSAAASAGEDLEVVLEDVRFDVRYAENETIADTIFEHGNAARGMFRCTIAHVKLKQPGASKEDVAKSLAQFLEAQGLRACITQASVAGASLPLVAYLKQCRPAHWRLLQKLDIESVDGRADGMAAPPDSAQQSTPGDPKDDPGS